MVECKGLLILGCGGHARSIADVALSSGIEQLLFIDSNAKDGEQFLGFPVQRIMEDSLSKGWMCLPGSGDNEQRKLQVEMAELRAWPLATLVAPSASIGISSMICPGSFVAHQAHIGPMAKVGKGCIINTGAIIEHDCIIGDYSHISIGAAIAGRSIVGDLCSLFAGSTVNDSIQICNDVIVGSGAVVIDNIQESGIYVGVPARRVNK
ncbi:MAG TPA: NeuD/PglB/VioB family sugar acetyltransferase [Alphaproteobacteria bacterium]|nr:NeuD/PglB/VioB family sugar acetyltransferase [Alphaproteobacteria bacterium]